MSDPHKVCRQYQPNCQKETGMPREYIKDEYAPEMENLLLILTKIQENCPEHYIRDEDIVWVAEYLKTTISSVYGVVNYYSMFSSQPRGRYVTRVCRSPVCTMLEGETLFENIETLLGITEGQVTGDGLFSIERVECLGQCERAPAMMINEEVYGNLDQEALVKIIEALRRKT